MRELDMSLLCTTVMHMTSIAWTFGSKVDFFHFEVHAGKVPLWDHAMHASGGSTGQTGAPRGPQTALRERVTCEGCTSTLTIQT